jgi:2-keto-4-pentenoate hydratase
MVAAIEPRLRTAMTRQFSRRDAALAGGAARVGWKLGAGNAERIGQGPVVGYLLSETLLAGGSSFQADAEGGLHVDAEVAVSMAADIDDDATDSEVMNSVGGVAVTLEIVELNEGDAVDIVAANIFHRGVVFASERDRSALADDAVGAVEVNGGTAASAPLPDDLAHRLRMASRTLHAMHERLLPGDRVITGSIVQVPVSPGDDVIATITGLPSARVRFALTR